MRSAGTLAAFRHWYLSHLLWNPEADEGRLRAEFMRGYYGGRAAPFMDRYVDVLEDCAARFAAWASARSASIWSSRVLNTVRSSLLASLRTYHF